MLKYYTYYTEASFMLSCEKPEMFQLKTQTINGGAVTRPQFALTWMETSKNKINVPKDKNKRKPSIHQMILFCKKVDYDPILPIFGKTNYEYLSLHIFLHVFICFAMCGKLWKSIHSAVTIISGKGHEKEPLVYLIFWLIKHLYGVWDPPTSCPQRACIPFTIKKNNMKFQYRQKKLNESHTNIMVIIIYENISMAQVEAWFLWQ